MSLGYRIIKNGLLLPDGWDFEQPLYTIGVDPYEEGVGVMEQLQPEFQRPFTIVTGERGAEEFHRATQQLVELYDSAVPTLEEQVLNVDSEDSNFYEWQIMQRNTNEIPASEITITTTDGVTEVLREDSNIEPNNIVSVQSVSTMTEEELIRYLDTLE